MEPIRPHPGRPAHEPAGAKFESGSPISRVGSARSSRAAGRGRPLFEPRPTWTPGPAGSWRAYRRPEADDLPELHSYAAGIKRDYAAVLNGLTLPYSSGPVEGHVNRIKMIKRQMFGRAKFDLLRKRVLLAN